MRKLTSIWPGRFMSLLVPAALVVSFFAPSSALAVKEMSLGGGGAGGSEGDPLDTNDVGGGGGGGTDMHDDPTPAPMINLLGFGTSGSQVLLIPEMVGGILIFRIIVVDKYDSDASAFSMEEYHAP